MNKNRLMLSLAVPRFVFNFMSRKSKQTYIVFDLKYKIYFQNKQAKYMTVCFYHVTYAFQSESTLYSCLNVKELLARSRREI